MRKVVLLGLLAGGCAYQTSTTAVAPMGGDMYSVGASAGAYAGGSSEARSLALQKAGTHCSSMGRNLAVRSVEPAGGRVDVTFQCLTTAPAQPMAPTPTMNININSRS